MPTNRGRLHACLLVALATTALGLTGCVERRYTIRTDPPGALVIANGEPLAGTTPVSKSFTYYGDRTFRIIKEGYETKEIIQPIKAPWFDNLITEFFTENLNPYTFRDEVEFSYKLEPSKPADSFEVRDRAEATRLDGQSGPKQRRGGLLGYFGF